MRGLYKSASVKARVTALTDRLRGRVAGETRERRVPTRFGETYVLETGDPSLRTVVLLHGGMTNHAFILYLLRHLVGRYHLVCPDMPGHAGFSAETRIDPRGDDYGRWLLEVLDRVGVGSADFVGASYGGFAVNRVIALRPAVVRSAVLLVPAGIVGMSTSSLVRHILGWQVLYSATRLRWFYRRIVDALFTDCDDEDVREFFRLTLTGMRIDTRPAKLSTTAESASFARPVHVIACEHDVIFDREALQKRVRQLYPRATFEVLHGARHSPSITADGIRSLNRRIIDALEHAGSPSRSGRAPDGVNA